MAGITQLTPAQTDETQAIFGRRYLSIESAPEQGNRKQRRDARRAQRRRPDGKRFGG